jgi:hypothetical protein
MSASHNPGGPANDWGIKVKFSQVIQLLSCIYLFFSIILLSFYMFTVQLQQRPACTRVYNRPNLRKYPFGSPLSYFT